MAAALSDSVPVKTGSVLTCYAKSFVFHIVSFFQRRLAWFSCDKFGQSHVHKICEINWSGLEVCLFSGLVVLALFYSSIAIRMCKLRVFNGRHPPVLHPFYMVEADGL